MESLCTPWGLPPPAYSFSHQQNRSRYGSTLEIRETCPASAQQNLLPRRQRSPSLPPISHYQQDQTNFETVESSKQTTVEVHQETNNNVKYRFEDGEGETSGYASDCVPQSSPEFWQNKQKFLNSLSANNMNECVDNTFSNYSTESRNQLPIPAWHHSTR